MTVALSRRALFHYSLLALPLAFAGLPLYVHTPDFYATQAGLSLASIGSIILYARLFDAFQDPVIGYLSSKFSKLRPAIMGLSILLLGMGFFMLFHPPATNISFWLLASLFITTTAFSIISINFNAMGSLWSTARNEKTRITSWREAMGLFGLLIAAILPHTLGLPVTSYVFVFMLLASSLIFFYWNNAYATILIENEGVTRPYDWHALFARKNILFFGVYSLSMLASAIPAVLVIFFIRDRLDAQSLSGIFLLLYFLSGAIGMPLWQHIAKRLDKHATWLIAMLLSIATFISAYFLEAGDIWFYGAVCLFSGIALGAELALPPAILSEMIDKKSSRDQTSFYFSVLSFLSKGVLALGSFIAFFILDLAEFIPATKNNDDALTALSITYALLPCIIKFIAAVLLWCLIKFEGENYEQIERTGSYGINNIS